MQKKERNGEKEEGAEEEKEETEEKEEGADTCRTLARPNNSLGQ